MKGTLSEGALPALLRAVYVGRKTGTLHFTRGQDVRSVRFRQGHILSAQSSVPQEHLGEVLVRNELLTAADLERAGARKRRDRQAPRARPCRRWGSSSASTSRTRWPSTCARCC